MGKDGFSEDSRGLRPGLGLSPLLSLEKEPGEKSWSKSYP